MDIGSDAPKRRWKNISSADMKALDDISAVRPDGAQKRDITQKEDQRLNQIGEKSFLYLTEES